MHLIMVLKVIGIMSMFYSITLIPPAILAIVYHDEGLFSFVASFFILVSIGFIFWLPVHKKRLELRTKDGFIVVVMFWVVLGLSGAIPFILSEHPHMSFTDAVFESISGLTTTGASSVADLDTLPRSILYYRHQQQWLGGMGIVVLAVAVLPMLGIGGMQLYRAETPGPIKDSKLTPRIKETAKALWLIYVILTIACALSYWAAGMSVYDAICHSFTTIAIGGYSTHNESIGFYNSPLIDSIAILFMILGGVNFALHFYAWRVKSLNIFWKDPECRFYLQLLVIFSIMIILGLYITDHYSTFGETFRYGLFQTVSIATTTGFSNTDTSSWPSSLIGILIISSVIGGCGGSTAGGIKIIRFLLMIKQGVREIARSIHPNSVITLKIGKKPVNDRVIEAVWGFIGAYIAVFVVLVILLLTTGMNFEASLSAVASVLSNGYAFGEISTQYSLIHPAAKWLLCFGMLLGRLEIFTLLVLLSPLFWRR